MAMFPTRNSRARKAGFATYLSRHSKLRTFASWLCIFEILTWTIAPAALGADRRIVTDGRTSTTLGGSGRTTDIHTRSVYGKNAYNSFRRFGVGPGNTVNLHVPGRADNLINLVREGRTDIDGTLNGVKNGQIGGNIYLLNPHGIVVGPNGTVNAGALSLQTPTSEFVDGVLDANGVPNSASVGRILNGSAPLGSGRISIQGQINTLDGIYLRGGGVDVSGALRAGSAGVKAMRQQVNLGGLVPAANTVHRTRSGAIVIGSPGNVRISGRVDASGEQDVKGGTVDIRADGNIDVEDGAIITARGFGANSDGGDIVVYAGDTARLAKGALIDASSGDSGRGGFVEFSAINVVSLDGGRLVASSPDGNTGIIYIDPATVSYTANTTLAAGLTTVEATEKIEVATNITVSTAKSGDAIVFRAPSIIMNAGSKVTTKHVAGATTTYGDITFETKKREAGDLVTPTDASITITNATIEGKDIVLDAQSINKSGLGWNKSSSNLTLAGATISGASVTIKATSEAEASILSTFDADGGVSQTPATAIMDLALIAASSNIAGFPLKAVVGIAEATANVNVNAGTTITATGELTIETEAKSTSDSPSYTDLALTGGEGKKALPTIGVVYASTRTTSQTNVASGATLNAGDKVEIKATTESSLDANNVTIVNSDANLGITIGEARTTTTAKVEKGATINLTSPDTTTTQTVEVAAENSSEYNAATNTISTTEGNNAALSATWLDIEETVKAELGASLAKADGVKVSAKSEIAGITAAADAGTGDPGKWDRLNNALQSQNFGEDTPEEPVHDAFVGRLTGQLSNMGNAFGGVDLGLPFQLAGTLSVADADIDVEARITAPSITTQGSKPSDEPDSEVGDVSVTSEVTLEGLQNIASGGAEDKEASNTAIAFAVPITSIDVFQRGDYRCRCQHQCQ
jgi:filamentous hemagglutinin family protein